MIVCVCQRVSDRDIVKAVDEGVCSFDTLRAQTGLGSHCGSCHDCAREIFDEACARRCAGAAGHTPFASILPCVGAA
jgi:bacterioferritin-associated ferredoxin